MKGPKQRILVVVCKKIRLNVRDGGVRAPLSAVRESGWRPGGRSTNVRKRVSGPPRMCVGGSSSSAVEISVFWSGA